MQSLPPRALSFFKKIEGDQFQRVDSSSRYTKSLRTVGYDEPGPHDIWVEVDMSEVVKPQPPEGMPTGTPVTRMGVRRKRVLSSTFDQTAV